MDLAEILQRILDHYSINHNMRQAYDHVLGQGAYDKLVSATYDAATAQPKGVTP